MFYIGKDSNV